MRIVQAFPFFLLLNHGVMANNDQILTPHSYAMMYLNDPCDDERYKDECIDFKKINAQLLMTYKALLDRASPIKETIDGDRRKELRETIVASQLAWTQYRDKDCEAVEASMEVFRTTRVYTCLAEDTRVRIARLEEINDWLDMWIESN